MISKKSAWVCALLVGIRGGCARIAVPCFISANFPQPTHATRSTRACPCSAARVMSGSRRRRTKASVNGAGCAGDVSPARSVLDCGREAAAFPRLVSEEHWQVKSGSFAAAVQDAARLSGRNSRAWIGPVRQRRGVPLLPQSGTIGGGTPAVIEQRATRRNDEFSGGT
jgi:hypothetical protein